MRKEIAVIAAAASASFLASFLIAAILLPSLTGGGVTTVTTALSVTSPQTEDEYLRSAEALLEKVVEWVEGFRGLKLREKVDVIVLTRSWVIEHWGKGFLNKTEVEIDEVLLKSLLIVPRDFNLTRFRIGFSGYTVAASSDHRIYVVREYFDPRDELRAGATLAHELTHILQGEYFSTPRPSTSDEEAALAALIEGDANLVSSTYLLEHGGKPSRIRESELTPLDALPFFPYIYGESFVRYVYERRGWDGVNEMYKDPPTSTAQVLHPEKYLEGWKPVKPDLPSPPGEGWRLLLRDTLGEYFVRQLVRAHLDSATANRSAEGWLGDRIEIYERNGLYLIRWKIVWEDEGELNEFLNAFEQVLEDAGARKSGEGFWSLEGERIQVQKTSGNAVLLTIYFEADG